jgi:hypothetical protein
LLKRTLGTIIDNKQYLDIEEVYRIKNLERENKMYNGLILGDNE